MNQVLRRSCYAWQAMRPALACLVACCLVLLQLVTALHFALVPHCFSAGLNGFVHEHEAHGEQRVGASQAERVPSGQPSVVSGVATCAPESCPIGFAGPHSLLLAAAQASGLLQLSVVAQALPPARLAVPRARALLNAPNTSPPFRV